MLQENEFLHEAIPLRSEADHDAVLQELGNAIHLRRKHLKMSQERLSALCGLHRTYISDIERGTRNIAIKNLLRIAEALEVPGWALVQRAETHARKDAEPAPVVAADDEGAAIS